MMGAGKTTVGRLLARRLKRAFYDSDQEIERRCGVRIPVIFDIEGEAGFRARETQVIAELCALEGIVLATGGGAVLAEENRRRLAARGTVIYLHARPGYLWQRVRHDRNRPLLATPDPQKKLRRALRASAIRSTARWPTSCIDTGKQSVQTLVKDLLARLEAPMQTLRVALGERSYPIHIGAGLLGDARSVRAVRQRQARRGRDQHGGRAALSRARAAGARARRARGRCRSLIEDGEQAKSWADARPRDRRAAGRAAAAATR